MLLLRELYQLGIAAFVINLTYLLIYNNIMIISQLYQTPEIFQDTNSHCCMQFTFSFLTPNHCLIFLPT